MTEALLTLSRRLVAAPGWRWLPGMLTACRVRVHECDSDYIIGHRPGPTKDGGGMVDMMDISGFLPDLSDPLTALGLLALVRERWKMPHLTVTRKNRWWTYRECAGVGLELHRICAPTETEALIAALEATP